MKGDLRYAMGSKSSRHERNDNEEETDVEHENRKTESSDIGENDLRLSTHSLQDERLPQETDIGRYSDLEI